MGGGGRVWTIHLFVGIHVYLLFYSLLDVA